MMILCAYPGMIRECRPILLPSNGGAQSLHMNLSVDCSDQNGEMTRKGHGQGG